MDFLDLFFPQRTIFCTDLFHARTKKNNNLYVDGKASVKVVASEDPRVEERRSTDAKVTYLTEFELSQPTRQFLQHERLQALKAYDNDDSGSNSDRSPRRRRSEEDELSGSE